MGNDPIKTVIAPSHPEAEALSELGTVSASPFYWELLTLSPSSTDVNPHWVNDVALTETFLALITAGWPIFCAHLDKNTLFKRLQSVPHIRTEIYWVTDAQMQQINQNYRGKEQPTDVVSFPLLLTEEDTLQPWLNLPEVDLGSIFLSVDWANTHGPETFTQEATPTVSSQLIFLLDRFFHGMLHLLGQHHDTQTDFDTVIAIQKTVRTQAIQRFTTSSAQ